MSIKFKSVSYKNFLSTGNQPTVFFLNRVPTALITGTNGAGKSTILDAITFGLYGKPYRNINKPQLVNTVNEKNLEVVLEFEVNEVPFKVIRGMKPNVFEIYRNNKLIEHDAAVKDYQNRLENIVGMNYKAFSQIVILGSARYQSFMDLSSNDRRTIIEEILDITVFSKMNSVLKTRITNNNLEEKDNEYRKDIQKTKIEGQTSLIDSLKNRKKESSEKIQEKKDKTLGEIKLLQIKANELDSDIRQYTLEEINALNQTLADVKSKANEVSRKAKELDNKISFYKNEEVCHSCEQELDEALKQKQIEKLEKEKDKLKSLANPIMKAINNSQKNLDNAIAVHDKVNSLNDDKRDIESQIKSLSLVVESIDKDQESSDNDKTSKELKGALKELKVMNKVLKDYEKETVAIAEEKHRLDICKILLKDDGIKAKIIKQYLPIMNQLINKFLDRMGANYSFTLDEQFNEIIKSRYRDTFSYASFSEGEKQRIDLALMFTWREIAKIKNSISTNLLILDEIGDSSMDGEGTDVLWEILNDMQDSNIFVISHKTSNVDKFRTHLEFYKDGNFSKIKNSK